MSISRRRRARVRAALALLAALAAAWPPAAAAEPQPALQVAAFAQGSINIAATEADTQGNAVVLWIGSGYAVPCFTASCFPSLYASDYLKGRGWGEAVIVVNGSAFSSFSYPYSPTVSYDLASDGRGNFTFAFTTEDPYGRTGGNVYARRFNVEAGWGPLVELAKGNASQSRASVVFDGSGAGVVGWYAMEYAGTYSYNATVWANRFDPADGWLPAEPMEFEDGYNITGPSFAMDGRGGITALWTRDSALRSRVFVPGAGWGDIETVADRTGIYPTDLRVAENGAGGVFAVFAGWSELTHGYEMRAIRKLPNQLWEQPVDLASSDFGSAEYPKVSAAGDGTALVVFAKTGNAGRFEMHAARSPLVGGWENAVRLDTTGQGDSQFAMAQDGSGRAVVVWPETSFTSAGAPLRMHWFDPVEGWQGAFTLYTVASGYAYLPGVAMTASGDLLLAWVAGGDQAQSGGFPNELWARWWAPEELVTERITLLPPSAPRFPTGSVLLLPLAAAAVAVPLVAWGVLAFNDRKRLRAKEE